MRVRRLEGLLLMAALWSGCEPVAPDFSGLGELGDGLFCGLVDAFTRRPSTIESEAGELQGYVGACGDARDCSDRRFVMRGLELELGVELPMRMQVREIRASSSDADRMTLEGFEPTYDDCDDAYVAFGTVSFEQPGEASLVFSQGDTELDRFTWSVAEPATLELSVSADAVLPRAKRYEVHAPLTLEANVRDAEGNRLLTGGREEWWLDDPGVVALFPSTSDVSSRGHGHYVLPIAAGSTTLHVLISNLETSIELVVPDDFVPPVAEERKQEEQP